jgi:hypothetical protein
VVRNFGQKRIQKVLSEPEERVRQDEQRHRPCDVACADEPKRQVERHASDVRDKQKLLLGTGEIRQRADQRRQADDHEFRGDVRKLPQALSGSVVITGLGNHIVDEIHLEHHRDHDHGEGLVGKIEQRPPDHFLGEPLGSLHAACSVLMNDDAHGLQSVGVGIS